MDGSHAHGDRGGRHGQAPLAFAVSKPSSPRPAAVQGVAFDSTGSIVPAIAADDSSTVVALQVSQMGRHHGASQVATIAAGLTGPDGDGTGYGASVVLPAEGEYSLVAVVMQGDVIVGRSRPRSVQARLPFSVSRPHVDKKAVVQGMPFDATGSVSPAIAADDPSMSIAIRIIKQGRHGSSSQVATADGAFTGPDANGNTGYVATVDLPSAGEYTLVAVVTQNGVVVGRSKGREMVAKLPYNVSRPQVVSSVQTTGTPFDATGSINPALAPDDASTTVAIQVFLVSRHDRVSQVATVDGAFTGPDADGNTGYAASIVLADPGRYALVTVLTRDGIVIGRSKPRYVSVQPATAADPVPVSIARTR